MNSPIPETRHSLILRLRDDRDVEAWDQFVSIYQPLVYRLARHKGLQDADAREVVQEVLLAVAKAVHRWQPDPERGRFRSWLFRISRNIAVNYLTRTRHRPQSPGGSSLHRRLEHCTAEATGDSALFELEYRRELFHFAAQQLQSRVAERTWNAFWKTCLEGRGIAEVAAELEMSRGAVRIARCRMQSQLAEIIAELSNEPEKG